MATKTAAQKAAALAAKAAADQTTHTGQASNPTGVTAPAVKRQASGGTVSVACKVPTGVVLQLCERINFVENTPAGPRDCFRYDRVGPRYVVRGPAMPNGQIPKGYKRPVLIGETGYAVTRGVPKEFWDKWVDQNKLNPIVRNGLIFAHGQAASTIDEARDNTKNMSGLEPLNPDGDARSPKGLGGVGAVEPTEEMRDRLAAGTEHMSEEDAEFAEA